MKQFKDSNKQKTAKMVTNLTNILGFKLKDEVSKTSFLIPPLLQSNIRKAIIVKDSNPLTHAAVCFHMKSGKVNTYPLHCENGNKTPEMLQIMAKKNTEITNLNHLICHKEENKTYYSLNR